VKQASFDRTGMRASVRLAFALSLSAGVVLGEDWPQWRGARRDGIWRETEIIDRFPDEGPPRKWTSPIGPGYTGPTVADGRVFCMDRVTKPSQQEQVLCWDAETGKEIWRFAYDCVYTISYTAGPRACVTIHGNEAYAIGAMGHLHCLDAATGAVLWARDPQTDFSLGDRMPIWGIAAAPLVHGPNVIVQIGASNACIVAFDRETGEEAWRSLDDRASYSAPILIQQGHQDVLVCWTGDSVAGLAPRTGEVYWRHPFPPSRMPIGVATPIIRKDRLFVTSFYDGSLMLELDPGRPEAKPAWHRCGPSEKETDALQSIISTPIWQGDHIYGVDSYGELRCLLASNGDRVWEDQTATPRARWSNIHIVPQGDRVWMFNERGELLIAKLSPGGFVEQSRAKILDPTTEQLRDRGGVCWAPPAFADRSVFVRSDREIVRVDLAKP